MLTYIAKELEEIEYQPNAWHGLKVGVFRVENDIEEQIGEYERNYGLLYDTFFHFTQNGKDFALYSPDYTVTRIMELPSCKDIGGEEAHSWGFCPVDYFVPSYVDVEYENTLDGTKSITRRNQPNQSDFVTETSEYVKADESKTKFLMNRRPLTSLLFYPFGFVAGCIWGDDGSWKIQHLDLSEAEKGVIKREEKFGYIELQPNLKLKEAIHMGSFGHIFGEETFSRIRISVLQQFDLQAGKWFDTTEIE